MEEAREQTWCRLQAEMSALVQEEEHPAATWEYVAGMDISFFKEDDKRAIASIAVCLWEDPNMPVAWSGQQEVTLTEPYVPQYLSFREAPHLIKLWRHFESERPEIATKTGLILVDGNGVLHPRQFGLASHIGVSLNMPTIGVAKTLLRMAGFPSEREVRVRLASECPNSGDYIPLMGQSEPPKSGSDLGVGDLICLGAAVRSTPKSCRPIYVSVGHRTTLSEAVKFVIHCCLHRIPEPIRQADLRSRDTIKRLQKCSY